MKKDYYKILEISFTASTDEIRKSYRRLALKYHPDRNPNDKVAENKFKEVATAYSILSDTEKKKEYDNSYNSGSQSHSNRTEQNQEGPVTPTTILNVIIKIKNQVVGLKKNLLNQLALYKSLNDLLSDNNIMFLLSRNETKINRRIIDEVLICCNYLAYPYIEKLTVKLAKLAGSENEIILNIYKYSKRKKLLSYWERNKGIAVFATVCIGIVGLILLMKLTVTDSRIPSNRPQSGNLYPENKNSALKNISSKNTEDLKPVEDYSSWDKVSLQNGGSPDCYNFKSQYDYSLDNKLQVSVGSHTDVVLKLINIKTEKCIRYVYIRSGSTYNIQNIPQGKYYTKIAYGYDWRQKVENGKCVGKFISNSLYKKGEEILDFNKVYKGITREGDSEYTNYEIPSFTLSLDVIASDFDSDNYQTNSISEEDFNE